MNIPFGSVVSWSVPPSNNGFFEMIFGYLQIFFTKMEQTHASIVLDFSRVFGDYYEFEATVTTRISRFNSNPYAKVFDIKASVEAKANAVNRLSEHLGKPYAIVQTIYFIPRWFFELFGIDTRRWWNPLGYFFLICSELVFRYLYMVANTEGWADLVDYMDQWKPDNVHAGDIAVILAWMKAVGYAEVV